MTNISKKDEENGMKKSNTKRYVIRDISINNMYRNESFFSMDGIEALADDILHVGILKPLEVLYAPTDKGDYKIVDGVRRWAALKMLVAQGYTRFETVACKIVVAKDEKSAKPIIAGDAHQR